MNLIIALHSEARPIISALGLIKDPKSHPFPLYRDELHNLVVSGTGSRRAAGATGYLLGKGLSSTPCFLNLGIAGHGCLPPGTGILGTRIIGDQEINAYYPPQIIQSELQRSTIRSVTQPITDYPEPIGYDMEAHSFYATASLGTSRELIHVLKVVSDNPQHSINNIDNSQVTRLIEGILPDFLSISNQLDSMVKCFSPRTEEASLNDLAHSIHSFSQTQAHQLNKLFRHAHSLSVEASILRPVLQSSKSPKEAIRNLEKIINPYRLLK